MAGVTGEVVLQGPPHEWPGSAPAGPSRPGTAASGLARLREAAPRTLGPRATRSVRRPDAWVPGEALTVPRDCHLQGRLRSDLAEAASQLRPRGTVGPLCGPRAS